MNTTHITNVIASKGFQVTAAAVLSGAISAVAGYRLAQRRLSGVYEELLRSEVAEAKQFYSALYKKEGFATPAQVVNTVTTIVTDEGEQDVVINPQARDAAIALQTYQGARPDVMTHNVFEDAKKTFDLTAEDVENRDPDKPYVITIDEFMDSDELHHQQVTLTYYADDDVLADERDLPVDDRAGSVGDEALSQFGVGSNDSRVVYVRNERISVDFEITLHDGNYAEIVHGVAPTPTPRKPRRPRPPGDDE